MHATTPRVISETVRDFCNFLVADPQPEYLRVHPLAVAKLKDCFATIERHVNVRGGRICYGWLILEWPRVLIEAEFHAVWRDDNGNLHELTPKPLPVERVLFLPDPERVYTGKQVNNVQRPLSSSPDILNYIRARDAEFEFLNRGARAEQHGEIELTDAEDAEEYKAIQRKIITAHMAIVARLPMPGRNDLCPCGSGKKLKDCHRVIPSHIAALFGATR